MYVVGKLHSYTNPRDCMDEMFCSLYPTLSPNRNRGGLSFELSPRRLVVLLEVHMPRENDEPHYFQLKLLDQDGNLGYIYLSAEEMTGWRLASCK